MTARIGTTSMDGTPISATDRARIEAEDALHGVHRRGAARAIAAASLDIEDCRTLLAMLGLDNDVVAAARVRDTGATKRARKRSVAA